MFTIVLVKEIWHLASEVMFPDLSKKDSPYSAFSRYLLLLAKDFWYLVGEGMFPDTKLPRTDQVITTRPLAES